MTIRPAPIMLEILPIILLRISQNFTYYSFLLSLLFQNYIRNTSFKIVESNEVKSLVLAANCKQDTI